ncbi:MAG: aspartyl/asparaginyl beta-hydroxylase domain-containing protein [Bryobacteraceae bacterium]
MLSGLQFPFRFDPIRLGADLACVRPEEWSPHYNEGDYGGQWRGAALRSACGSAGDLSAQPRHGGGFADTPLLDRCPYFREVLAALPCPLKSVRLLGLGPGAFIREHSDHALEYADGEIRIHIPVRTNPDVEFYVAGERLLLEEGGCYYVNVNLPHRVNNGGATERIHLVIDAEVNEWVHGLFRRAMEEGWQIARCAAPPRGFADFRDWVIQLPELREQLRRIANRRELVARAVELGREAGFQFTEADVGASCHAASRVPSIEAPEGWTPVKVSFRGSSPNPPQAVAEWIWTGPMRFTEPFFQDSVRVARRNPFTAVFGREMPLEAADRIQGLTPNGFIFHMSRCGSTLIAQMLVALDRTVVISEAPAVDDVLQAKLRWPDLPRQEQIRWLRQVVAALGQRPSGGESLYFLKLDSWHIHHLPLIREAFPGVPWIFVHRNPKDVIASQLRRPGMPGLPGALDPRALRLRFEDITALGREEWCARVIAGFLEAAEAFRGDPDGLFVDYAELPGAVWGPMASHFGVRFSEEERTHMREAARFDSKSPGQLFQGVGNS